MNMYAIDFFCNNQKTALLITIFLAWVIMPQNLQSQEKKAENSKTLNVFSSLTNSINNYFHPPFPHGNIEQTTQEALSDTMLYTILAGFKSPTAPFSYGQYLIFIHYDKSEDARVSIAFADEQYTQKHYFVRLKSTPRILAYILPKEESPRTLQYRLIINGIWTHDYQNPHSIVDHNNLQVSVTTMNATPRIFFPSFVYDRHKKQLRFFLYLNTNKTSLLINTSLRTIDSSSIEHAPIYLVGNFTAWDPLLIRMQKSPDVENFYYTDISLNEGTYHYYFQVGNYDILDPQSRTITQRRSKGLYVNTLVIDKAINNQTGAPYLVARAPTTSP